MSKKKPKSEELDTQTQFTDMNVEGMPWYDPKKKQADLESENKPQKIQKPVSRKEYWRLVGATYLSWLPIIGVILAIAVTLFLVSYFWLGK